MIIFETISPFVNFRANGWLVVNSDKIHPPVTQTEINDVKNIGEGWSGKLAFLFTEI